MARYDITHACGHVNQHNILGTNVRGERERKAKWLAESNCRDCYSAARKAQRDEAAARATQLADAEGWPELTGSPKQVTWAQEIRATGIANLIDQIAAAWGEQHTQGEVPKLIINAALGQTDARWWIDRRDLNTPIRRLSDLVEAPGVARYEHGSLLAAVLGTMPQPERDRIAEHTNSNNHDPKETK